MSAAPPGRSGSRAGATNALLEVPIFGTASAAAAVAAGAARIELNAGGSYPAGGITPSTDELASLNGILASHEAAGSRQQLSNGMRDEQRKQQQQRQEEGEQRNVSVRVMIRPRGPPPPSDLAAADDERDDQELQHGMDFIYTPAEVDVMEASLRALKLQLDLARGDGFVFGALCRVADEAGSSIWTPAAEPAQQASSKTSSSSSIISAGGSMNIDIDTMTCVRLVTAARPFPCVFHRAFDVLVTAGRQSSSALSVLLRKVKDLGFSAILTSGGLGNAVDHVAVISPNHTAAAEGGGDGNLADIVGLADICGLEIIVGGGVRSGNVSGVIQGLRLQGAASATAADGHETKNEDGEAGVARRRRQWVHSSCLTTTGSEDVDEDEVRKIVQAIDL
ncbi:copper homeostasis protein [Microdochium nivale]|nr:copper homeostasis protein [Microdochium nivale]